MTQTAVPVDYTLLERQVTALLEDESDWLANASNFAAFMFTSLPQVNWAGFYFPGEGALVLGPFGGKPACTRLPDGRGVCGAAFVQRQTVVVDDVNAFGDHIACDSASQSEIVVPLMKDGTIYGVFDIDAPVKARFNEADRDGIERLVAAFMRSAALPEQYRSTV
ncbi:MAG TPA: GAF domain-containing protein [Candidatus Baltobacteraceae bacterium]|nr:GAF domain-containing protein [Candidatus Baltobacteraceae bacterium]